MKYKDTTIEMCKNKTTQQISKTKSLDYELTEDTPFLNVLPKVTYTTRVYCVLNNIHEIPKCKKCNSLCTPNKADAKLGFTEYCSPKCSRSDKTVHESAALKLSDRDWLYNQRINLQKSKELIANELGVSTTPINKWIDFHKIPEIRYNCANANAISKISNRNWLFDQHKNQNKKCDDIAAELGISKSTVSVWLAKHNIDGNKPNSYDRDHNIVSKECQEVVDFVRTIYSGEIKLNDRKILNGFELDILLPEKNIAIEYNGVYSHLYRPEENTPSSIKSGKYHVGKTDGCSVNGIRLVHIFSDSWKSKRAIWESYLKNKLGATGNKVFARKCEIIEIETHTKTAFLNDNHLQGSDKSSKKYGLYHNDELVSVMTFGKSRYNKNYDWELMRFAVKKNFNVVGGFSKLLKHFRKTHIGSIVSYADLSYSNGDVYMKNGFVLVSKNKPSYHYVMKNTEIRLHRSNFTKNKITKDKSDSRTEEELMRDAGYSKIFDCGTLTFAIA